MKADKEKAKFNLPHRRPAGLEKHGGKSMTVPGEETRIRDLVLRFAQTGDASDHGRVTKQGTYMEDPDFDDDDLEKVAVSDVADQEELLSVRTTERKEAERLIQEKRKAKVKPRAEQRKTEAKPKPKAEPEPEDAKEPSEDPE